MATVNKVMLIGNLTRDPELRYTPQGSAVCEFGIALKRKWTSKSGEKKEEVDFIEIVAWTRQAEICKEFLSKGRSVFVEGRLTQDRWEIRFRSVRELRPNCRGRGSQGGGGNLTSLGPPDARRTSGPSAWRREKPTARTRAAADAERRPGKGGSPA